MIQGASRGIGLEFVRRYLGSRQVSRVFATCREPLAAKALQSTSRDAGSRLELIPLDVTDETSVESAAGQVAAMTERLDILVNCAGLLHEPKGLAPERRLGQVEPEAMVKSFRVNALGPLLVAKHFHELFAPDRRAVFASISARVGSIGDNQLGGWYAYRTAKAAQNMITKNLSIELGRRRRSLICVALHPGTTDTELSRPFQRNVPPGKLFSTERSVGHLLDVIDGLSVESNGRFYAWDGQEIPW